jgi:signal transduction histidine kinase
LLKQKKEWGIRLKKNITYLIDFIREKSAIGILYILTIGFFLLVGYLDHVEDLRKLLYAMILSTFFWIFAAFLSFFNYRKKRLLLNQKHFYLKEEGEYNPDVFLDLTKQSNTALEADYQKIFLEMQEKNQILLKETEKKQAERNDYFLLWTHQIKTPMAALRLLFDQKEDSMILKQELFKVEQYVDMMLQYQRLSDMANDLLLKEEELGNLIRRAIKKFGIIFIQKGIRLELAEFESRIVTDEKWFCFAIEQILSNSLKYSDGGSIRIYLTDQEIGKLTLCIEDEGCGIKAEDLPRIFERGFTGYNGRGASKSTGIGLFMCKQILDKLGFEIWVKSEEGKGTKVYLNLTKM